MKAFLTLGPLTDEFTAAHYAARLQPCYADAKWQVANPVFRDNFLQQVVLDIPTADRIASVILDLRAANGGRYTDGVQCAGLRVEKQPEGFVLQADPVLYAFYRKRWT